MATLIILWTPMLSYLIFGILPAEQVNVQHVIRAGVLNLLVGVPIFGFITTRWILKQ
jgi:hypothetical protein